MILFENNLETTPIGGIIHICESTFKQNLASIFVKTRKREIVTNRQIFYYVAKTNTKMSYAVIIKEINDIFGFAQDHSTLVHAMKTIRNLLSYDKELQGLINRLNEKIQGSAFLGISIAVAEVDLLETCILNTMVLRPNTYLPKR